MSAIYAGTVVAICSYYIATNGDLYVPQANDCTAGTYRCVAAISAQASIYSNNVTIALLSKSTSRPDQPDAIQRASFRFQCHIIFYISIL